MYQALYRKYRPQKFEDVVGQKVIVKTLCNAIIHNKITHAYLFAGPRGTGKTSIAKIFAKTINCEHLSNLTPCDECLSCAQFNNKQTVDIIEIDAASNNGVEEIREIKNKVNLVPTNGKYKVYIIDEVHMLTTAAFNAMLKTLEEPPKNVIFILATTEPHKIPLTILSRCQRYDFKRLSNNEIVERLLFIVNNEKINVEDGVLDMIAEISNGGMRDSIGLLDQLITYCDDIIRLEDVHELNGTINSEQIFMFVDKMLSKNYHDVYDLLNKYNDEGKNLSKILENIIDYLKNILIYINCPNFFNDNSVKNCYDQLFKLTNENELYIYIDNFLDTLKLIKMENNKKLLIELCLIKIYNLLGNNSKITNNDTKLANNFYDLNMNKEQKDIIVTSNLVDNIKMIKKVRINNTLSKFSKRDLIEFKNSIGKINELINVPEYSSVISLILDGELKARGDNNLIFVYTSESLEQLFNSEIIKIEKIFNEVFNVNYKVIGVNSREWEIIKKDFNNSMKNKENRYFYQEENFNVEELLNISNKGEEIVKNDIDNMFAEIVEYK